MHYEFMDFGEGEPQLNERLFVWQKVLGLEGETEKVRENAKGMHREKDD